MQVERPSPFRFCVKMADMYYVYLLASQRTKWIYVGFTNNLWRRIEEHNSGKSEYAASRGPWRLVYFEAFSSKEDAIEREQQLKRHANTLGLLRKRIARSLKGEGSGGRVSNAQESARKRGIAPGNRG